MAKKSFRELLYFDEVKVASKANSELDTDKYNNSVNLTLNEGERSYSTDVPKLPESNSSLSTKQDYSNLSIYRLNENSNTVIEPKSIKVPDRSNNSTIATDTFHQVKLNKIRKNLNLDKYKSSKVIWKESEVPNNSIDESKYHSIEELVYKTGDDWEKEKYQKPVTPLDPLYDVLDKVTKKINAANRIVKDVSKVAGLYGLNKLGSGSDNLSTVFSKADNVVNYINRVTRDHVEPIVVNGKQELEDQGIDLLNRGFKKLLNPDDPSESVLKSIYTDEKSRIINSFAFNPSTKDVTEAQYNRIGRDLKKYFKSIYPKLDDRTSDSMASRVQSVATQRAGTLSAVSSKTIDNILKYTDSQLGRIFTSFEDQLKAEERIKYSTTYTSYYSLISSPYLTDKSISSPYEALQYACNNLGFSRGYHDYSGFSVGSDGIWGMTIEPYVSPLKVKSLAPPLPKLSIPTWSSTIKESGNEPRLVNKVFDFGKTPPVLNYQIQWAQSRSKKIDLANESSISIPLGLQYNPTITITFGDDEHHSMRNYMGLYFNTIFKPDKGLMAPYDLASFLITITSFKPGLKVNFMFKLICVPIDYTMSYEGSEAHTGSSVTVTMSIVGMRSPDNMQGKVDSTLETWKDVSWKDVTVVPCNYGGMVGSGNDDILITNRSIGGQIIAVNGG